MSVVILGGNERTHAVLKKGGTFCGCLYVRDGCGTPDLLIFADATVCPLQGAEQVFFRF